MAGKHGEKTFKRELEVAYAGFFTAMMASSLPIWVLNATIGAWDWPTIQSE